MAIVFDDEQPKQSKIVFDDEKPAEDKGFLGNAMEDVKGNLGVLNRAAKGITDLPSDIYQTGKQEMKGGDYNRTPLSQDAQTVGSAVMGAIPHVEFDPNHPTDTSQYQFKPGSLFNQYRDIAAQPFKMLPGQAGEEFKKAYPENPFTQHPVNTAMALFPLAKPAAALASEIPGVDEAVNSTREAVAKPFQNAAQNFGRRALGFSKQYLNKTQGQLPAANAVAQTALDTGVIRNPIFHPLSSSSEDMLSRANALDESSGQAMGGYLKSQGANFDPYDAMQKLEELKAKLPPDDAIASQISNAQDLIAKTADRFNGNIPFDEANKLKSYIQKKVPWNTDKASAEVGQKVAGTVRGSLDSQLQGISDKGGTGEDFQNFLQNKKLFGQSQMMKKGLLNQTAGESGNLPLSPYSVLMGIGEGVKGGSVLKAVVTALASEWTKRFGSATAATMANSAAKMFLGNPAKYSSMLSTVGPTVGAIESALSQEPDFHVIYPNQNQAQPLFKKSAAAPTPNTNQQVAMAPTPSSQAPAAPQPKKYLDEKTARRYLEKAGGDKGMARQIAQSDGWTVA